MTLTLYDVSIPPFIHGLNILSQLLRKGQEYASASDGKVTENTLATSRLIDDQKPFAFQIQRVSGNAISVAVRVGGVVPITFTDTETTFAELKERTQDTIKFLETVKESDVNAGEEVELEHGGRKFTGRQFVLEHAVPNFYFHLVTAYGLLRKEGVPIGKKDYLRLE